MSKLEWGAVAAVLGLAIVSQIPHHAHEAKPGNEHADHAIGEAATGDAATVTLAVSGMT